MAVPVRGGGIEALADLPRSGRPSVVDEAAVVVATLNPPPVGLGVTHWSARLLSQHLRGEGTPVSFAEVVRIWRAWGPQPHRVETFKFSTDPQLAAKIRDVVGLYLDPPEKAIRRGTFISVADLIGEIRLFIDGYNQRCKPFAWTKTAKEILTLASGRQVPQG